MRIDFFEEFPTEENVQKALLLTGPSLIYLGARSLMEFDAAAALLKKANPALEAGYWPILENSYWVSPFSYSSELQGLKEELCQRGSNLNVLLDLELPLLRPSLFGRNLFSFFKNRSLIRDILSLHMNDGIRISTAEYPTAMGFARPLMRAFGISYSAKRYGHERIIMFYSSMARSMFGKDLRSWIMSLLTGESQKKPRVAVGLGTIEVGIFGTEPILDSRELDLDLAFCKSHDIPRAVIFRLGGLDEERAAVIRNYSDPIP